LDRERRNIARAAGMQAKHRPASGKWSTGHGSGR
jgi:hypothetical protein